MKRKSQENCFLAGTPKSEQRDVVVKLVSATVALYTFQQGRGKIGKPG